jgi:hypothetical protein
MLKRLLYLVLLALAATVPAFGQVQIPILSGVVTIDASQQVNSKVILTANVSSVVIQNPLPAKEVTILFQQDTTGGRTVTFGGNIASANLPTITSTASVSTLVTLQYDANSNTWVGISATGSGGSGGVSSFTGDGGLLTNSASTGAVTASLGTAGAYYVWGNMTGSTAAPAYAALLGAAMPSTVVQTNQGNTYSGLNLQDFTSATFILPKAASYAPTTVGLFGYDTTNNRAVLGNGTNTSFLTWITSAPTTGHCPQFSGTLGLLADSGAACGAALSGLTTGFLPKAASASTIANSACDDGITTANTFTCSDSAGANFKTVTVAGTGAGAVVMTAGTAQGHATASTVTLEAPASVTAYEMELPTTVPSGSSTFLSCTAANPTVCSFAAGGSGLTVNGSGSATNLSSSTPALPANNPGSQLVQFQGSGANASGYIAGFVPRPSLGGLRWHATRCGYDPGDSNFQCAPNTESIAQTVGSGGRNAPSSGLPETVTYTSSTTTNNDVGWIGGQSTRTGTNALLIDGSALSSTSSIRWYFGLTDSTTGTFTQTDALGATNTAFFRYSTSASDTNFQCITANGSTQTVTNSSVAADTANHWFAIIANDSVPNYVFYIDGTLVCTVTATLPAAGHNLGATNYVTTLTTAAKSFTDTGMYIESDH